MEAQLLRRSFQFGGFSGHMTTHHLTRRTGSSPGGIEFTLMESKKKLTDRGFVSRYLHLEVGRKFEVVAAGK